MRSLQVIAQNAQIASHRWGLFWNFFKGGGCLYDIHTHFLMSAVMHLCFHAFLFLIREFFRSLLFFFLHISPKLPLNKNAINIYFLTSLIHRLTLNSNSEFSAPSQPQAIIFLSYCKHTSLYFFKFFKPQSHVLSFPRCRCDSQSSLSHHKTLQCEHQCHTLMSQR